MLVDPAFKSSSSRPTSLSPSLTSPTKTLSPTPNECPSLVAESKQSDFWFKDGNVILFADNVAFKVHRGHFERHSEMFRDLLSLPQPVESPTFEDCYIIELHDSPADLWYLLKALYDGLYFRQLSASDFNNISAVLRLSTKYLIEHLRERCISRLMIDWPSTLCAWDSREVEATDSSGRYSPRARFAHPILVINFAREMNLNGILPCAFYDLCRYGPSKIVAGALKSRADGPIFQFKKSRSSSSSSSHIEANSTSTTHLSLNDLHTALLGRERAHRVIANFIEEELSNREPADDCHNRDRDGGRVCRESFYFIMLNLLRSVSGLANGRECDPLFTLAQASDMMSRSDFHDGTALCGLKICAACKADFASSVKSARERVWLQIPSWFGMVDFSGVPVCGATT